MTHFALFCPPYPGHLNPMAALASGLRARGHRITWIAQADAVVMAAQANLAFVPVTPAESLDRRLSRLSRTRGLLGIGGVIRAIARATDRLCLEAPDILRQIGAEAVICDATEAAGGLVARHLGLPFVSVANALLTNREPSVPPLFIGWAYDDSAWGLQRNRGGYRVADWMLRPVEEIVGRHARAWGLAGIETVEDCLSPILQLSQTVEGFDFPRREAPKALIHVGPLRMPEAEHWESHDPRPGIFCSLGTLQGGRFDIFRTVAEACRDLDLGLVIAHGGKLDAKAAAALPGAPCIEAFVPQRAVMAGMSAVVTHGGLNTVLDALEAGLPLVVVPLAFEQGAIAARVERCGSGLIIPPRKLTPAALRAALTRLLAEPAFRSRARNLAGEMASAGGVPRAVDLIEAIVRSAPASRDSGPPIR